MELGDFVFAASHDLQEPLRKIQTFCDMAIKRADSSLDREGREYMDLVVRSATRMRQHLQDLLRYTGTASKPDQIEAVDLGKTARIAADFFEESLKTSDGLLEIESMPVIEAVADQMLLLFQSLIDNALKFHGKDSPRIRIHGTEKDGYCEIEVKDNGIGFESRFSGLIFKPFQRLHAWDKYEGSGMGLAICRKIVEWHGGNIRAESEPEKGAAFIIRMPVKHDL